MKKLEEITDILAKSRNDWQQRYPIKEIGVFGSYVNGTATEESDVDILVHLAQPIGLDFVILAEELEAFLETKVDLVSFKAIKPGMLPFVRENLIYI